MNGSIGDIKAIVFDMNGVIVDDEKIHEQAFGLAFIERGLELTHRQYAELFLGRTDRDAVEAVCLKRNITIDIGEILNAKKDHYWKLAHNGLVPFPGIVGFIHESSKRFPIALASCASSADIDCVLSAFEIRNLFSVIVSGQDVRKGKPDPEIYQTAARLLGIAPVNCLAIEDTMIGIRSAQEAGMKCLAVANTCSRSQLIKHADIVIDSFQGVSIDILLPAEPPVHV